MISSSSKPSCSCNSLLSSINNSSFSKYKLSINSYFNHYFIIFYNIIVIFKSYIMVKLDTITQDDYNDIAELTSIDKVMKYVGNGKIYSSKKVKKFIKYCEIENKQSDKKRKQYYYKIVDNNKFIGIIGFHLFQNKDYYLSVYTNPKYQGKGYFSKALSLLLKKVATHKPQLSFIISLVYKNNKKMNAISRKKFTFNKTITLNGKKMNEYKIDIPHYKNNKKRKWSKKKTKKQSSTKKKTIKILLSS